MTTIKSPFVIISTAVGRSGSDNIDKQASPELESCAVISPSTHIHTCICFM